MSEDSNQQLEVENSEKPFLDEIAERLFSGHAAVMVGAGFSRNAVPKDEALPEFPTWIELSDVFYEKLYEKDQKKEKKYLNPLKLALQVETNFGRPALNKMIFDRIPDLYYEPSRLHEKLLKLPWQDVFTTNYDTLLERASRKVLESRYSLIMNYDDLIYAERPRIIKLHGSLPSTKPFIITEEDYRQYPKKFAPFVNTVQQSLIENALCMIGFSGDDPNFLQWIGWIRDNIGESRASKMYFIGLDSINQIDRTIFDQRHIIYIDASKMTENEKPEAKIEAVLDYIASKERRDRGIYWSVKNDPLYLNLKEPIDKPFEIQKVVSHWKDTRIAYPGWCITPARYRESLWTHTFGWTNFLAKGEALPGFVDLDFFYELNWRLEHCFYPLFDNIAQTMRDCLARYWPFDDQNLLLESVSTIKNPQINENQNYRRNQWCWIALSLLRYYRENGFSNDWNLFDKILKDHEAFLSLEQKANFAYERCLYFIFEVELDGLDKELEAWPENKSLAFWEAKRAGLLAERGRMEEAVNILDGSLANIRAKQNLKPVSSDFRLMSQEAYVMVLRKYVGDALKYSRITNREQKDMTSDFSNRWTELKQYSCDPWDELNIFEMKLKSEPQQHSNVSMQYGFDIGSLSKTVFLANGIDTRTLDGYSFFRFLEETAIPIVIPSMNFGKNAAIEALSRIAPYSAQWASCEVARIGDMTVADQLFSRYELARLDQPMIDEYVSSYISKVTRINNSITKPSRLYQTSIGYYAMQVIPEILSRLCCKSSREAHERILSFIEEVYQSKNKVLYRGIDHLVRRFINSATFEELDSYIPRFLELEIPQETNPLVEDQFINPLLLVFNSEYMGEGKSHNICVKKETIEELFQNATNQSEKTRTWSIISLLSLHRLGVLNEEQKSRFGKLVWTESLGEQVPECAGLRNFVFLGLTIPKGVDAPARFKQYLLQSPLPVIGNTHKGISITRGDSPIIADFLGSARLLDWTVSDARTLLEKLIKWWDSDKEYLKTKEPEEVSFGFASTRGEARDRLRNLSSIMTNVISPVLCRETTDEDKKQIRRLIDEAQSFDMPYLDMKLAFIRLFPEERTILINEISDALCSSSEDRITDALNAILGLSNYPDEETPLLSDEIEALLSEASNIVRWRYEPGLANAMYIMSLFLSKKPKYLRGKIESNIVAGLEEIEHETDPTILEANEIEKKLYTRKSAAHLSFLLFKLYQSSLNDFPKPVQHWRKICSSGNEFAEIRNTWESHI